MNKKIYILAACVFVVSVTSAQLSYGPKAGLNMSKLLFTNKDFSTSFKPGFLIGGFANYRINEKMALQGEVFYSMEGTKEKRTSSGTTGYISKSYLQVPLLFQYNVFNRFYAEAGAQLGILLSSKESWGNSKNNIKKYYKTTDLRIPIGIGYSFDNKLNGLSADIRYSFSLTKINTIEVGGGSLKNQVISLGVQYKLPSWK